MKVSSFSLGVLRLTRSCWSYPLVSNTAPDLQYIGKTHQDIKVKVNEHFVDVWETVQQNRNIKSKTPASEEFTNSEFAQHFARHCRTAKSEKEVKKWCMENVKVERQRIDEERGEDDEAIRTRTVYQLSCKGCQVSNF